jgi:hypothetical protein
MTGWMQYNYPAIKMSILPDDKRYSIFLACLAMLGLVIVLVTTSKYGAGVSSDAVRAMSTAEGLLAGRGFTDFVGAPYFHWPPLYPLVLAGLGRLTGLDIFHVGWYLNVLLFPLNIWLWGILFHRIFPDRPSYAYLGSLVALISSSMVRVYANVASDPLFITFMLVFFLAAGEYLQDVSGRALWTMFVMAGLGMLQRYLGIVFFGVAGLAVLFRRNLSGLIKSIPAVIVCFLPSAGWLFFHNYVQYQTIFGPRSYDQMWPLENISLSLTKILHWFLPYAPGLKEFLFRPWTVLLPVLFVLGLLNFKARENWAAWGRALAGRYAWPALLFSLIYYFLLAFTVNTIDHRDLTSDRYYVIILPAILVFLFITFDHLVRPHLNFGAAWARSAGIAAIVLWLIYPVYDLQEYLRSALVNGEPSNYNIYNSRFFNELQLVDEGRGLAEAEPDAVIYSNYVNALWFQYHRPIHVLLPVDNELPQEERVAILQQAHPGWPGDESGYIVWFTPNEYKYLAPISDLKMIADLELVYQDDFGEIYRVTQK